MAILSPTGQGYGEQRSSGVNPDSGQVEKKDSQVSPQRQGSSKEPIIESAGVKRGFPGPDESADFLSFRKALPCFSAIEIQ
jgi:hypothetical protein